MNAVDICSFNVYQYVGTCGNPVMCVPVGALTSQDETGVELHTKVRTDMGGGDWYSAEKHLWTASAEERATYA